MVLIGGDESDRAPSDSGSGLGLVGEGNQSTAEAKSETYQRPEPSKPHPPSHKYRKYEHPTEGEHRTAEQFSWRNTSVLMFVTSVFAGLAALFAYKTYCETRRQADIANAALVESNRAWIDVKINAANTFVFWDSTQGAGLNTTVTGINDGNSPANDVTLYATLVIEESGDVDAIKGHLKKRCDRGPGAHIIFVKDEMSQTHISYFGWKEVHDFEVLTAKFKGAPREDIKIPWAIAVCATYRVVGDSQFHTTERVFNIDLPRAGNRFTYAAVGEPIERGQFTLSRDFEWDYTD